MKQKSLIGKHTAHPPANLVPRTSNNPLPVKTYYAKNHLKDFLALHVSLKNYTVLNLVLLQLTMLSSQKGKLLEKTVIFATKNL